MINREFQHLVSEAERQPFSGWNFSYLRDRMLEAEVDWDYESIVRGHLPAVDAVLDMGTGGGEFLSTLTPLPARTIATEAYPPNVEIARKRLTPLGVEVVAIEGAPDNADIGPGEGVGSLPFPDEYFPLVINRHESYYPAEVYRILRRGGRFITQQVGGEHNRELNRLLGAASQYQPRWNLAFAIRQLEEAGLRVVDRREAYPETMFLDIGSIVYYLKAVPWQVPDFTVERYRDRLAALHHHMAREGGLRIRGHFFYLEAVRPDSHNR